MTGAAGSDTPAAVITTRPAEDQPADVAGDGAGGGVPALVVAVEGEVDMTDAQALIAAVRAACRRAALVVIDLDGVTFFGSAGLSALLATQHLGREIATTVAVVIGPAQKKVHRALALTNLARHLPIHHDLTAALAARDHHR